jgi:hypothetical protein
LCLNVIWQTSTASTRPDRRRFRIAEADDHIAL